ncbi:tubulin epsilon chain isoform X2 [Camelus ferus]|uniref:Tubulin epsilon chain n=2 Tax=Camelus TaxID=9836 RepID=A0A8B8TEK1_CAMFR|nr:tubulin epsilon chain isoform X2 [Camelus dromedarius]XP_032340612.1 tubulin epsilon chain isoform X2 [Camelus ferus]
MFTRHRGSEGRRPSRYGNGETQVHLRGLLTENLSLNVEKSGATAATGGSSVTYGRPAPSESAVVGGEYEGRRGLPGAAGRPPSGMTQSVVVQVGQCGNQIGCCFWDLALREHAAVNQKGIYDEAISSFFRNVDTRAVGHKVFGSLYQEQILEKLRKSAEHCDCLQCFFIIHSMGGGTGSGLGTFLLKVLEDEFPEVYRFVTSIYPSGEDDVITSPYNSILAMKELNEHADCVLPIDNQSLFDIISKIELMMNSGKLGTVIKPKSLVTSSAGTSKKRQEKPFDKMNNIVANLLLNLTSSARFEGSLNMDLNEISMNLVPFPQLHYLVSSLTPLYTLADVNIPPRRLDQMFSDAFSKDHQLIRADPKHSLYLACALMVRGNVQISDLRRNIERLKPSLQFVSWNQEGWKTSLCSVPPVGHTHSLLALANNTCVKPTFIELRERFMRLYKKKAHLHHYLQIEGMEEGCFTEAVSSLSALIQEYNQLDATKSLPVEDIPRLSVAV